MATTQGASGDSLDGTRNTKYVEWVKDVELPSEARQLFPAGINVRVLRQNPLSKRWTLYAQSRSGGPTKPKGYVTKPRADPRALELPELDPSGRCPFCPGTEEKYTPGETCRVLPSGELIEREGLPEHDIDAWLARAVRNKFPYFISLPDLYATPFPGESTALIRGELDNDYTNPWHDHPQYVQVDAIGASEVIVESPKHNGQLAISTSEQVFHSLRVLATRGRSLRSHSGCKQLAYFKQYGGSAGGSLPHPHMQVHALPIITGSMQSTLKRHHDYFSTHGGACAVERLYVADVISADSPSFFRLVRESNHFVASVPYAAYHAGRIVLAPKRHVQRFEDCSDDELSDLAGLLQLVMAAVYRATDDRHYHVFWETLPTAHGLADLPDPESYEACFRFSLHVRAVRNTMGITTASGVDFAASLPEQAAQEYRELIKQELQSPLRDQPRMSQHELLAQQLLAKEKEVEELKLKIEKLTSTEQH